jgi:hypothetical protein
MLEGSFSKSDFTAPKTPPITPTALPPATPKPTDPSAEVESFLAGYSLTEAEAFELSPVRPSDNFRHDAALLIHNLYQPGELVNVVTKYNQNGPKANPAGLGETLERDALLDRLATQNAPESLAGAWLRMNPLDGQGVADANVTSYRFILLESDVIRPDLWLSLMFRVPMPIAALIDSGNKSIHAWLKVDCATSCEYKDTFERIQRHLEPLGVDKSNKNPSRLSRLPGVVRSIPLPETRQRLLYLNPKASGMDWDAFEAALKVEGKEQKRLRELFMSRLYVPGEEVEPPETVFYLKGKQNEDVSVCTVGNVSTIFASEGAGKSAAMAAAISAALVPEGHFV